MPPECHGPAEKMPSDLVLGYLDEHPRAMDTHERLTKWWMEQWLIRVDVEALADVARTIGGARETREANGDRIRAALCRPSSQPLGDH